MKTILMMGVALVMGMTTAQAQNLTRADVEKIIKEYIQKNPEVILDSVEAYGQQAQQKSLEERQKTIQEHLSWLENNDDLPTAGNPKGDVTIVEFFDYNCGYCKKALTDVLTLIEEDKNVKVVFVETPILGPSSSEAAKWSTAAKFQNRYLDYHIALMGHRGPMNEAALITNAEKVGLDVKQMKKDMNSAKVKDLLSEKAEKTNQMQISGTPAFVINGKLYPGYIGLDGMKRAVAQARK